MCKTFAIETNESRISSFDKWELSNTPLTRECQLSCIGINKIIERALWICLDAKKKKKQQTHKLR